MRTVGVLDRTGALLPVVETAQRRLPGQSEVRDMGRAADLQPGAERVDVLVLGRKECTAAGVRRLARWAAAYPGTAVVAFVGEDNPLANSDLRAAGVDVLLRREPTPARVVSALRKAHAVLDLLAEQAHAEPEEDLLLEDDLPEEPVDLAKAVPAPRAEEPVEEQPVDEEPVKGAVITIASATGGCGKTFFATNLASLLADAGLRVLLVDMDLQFGEVAAALRVRHPYSVYDGLYDANGRPLPESDLAEHLEALVAHHALGFDVLTAPREPALADYVGARDVGRVLDVVTDRYEVVLVDTPPSLNEVVLTALDRSDMVAVLATLDVPSLKNLTVFLDTLHRLRVDDGLLRLVMNKVEPDVGIDMPQAQQAFDDRFVSALAQSRAVSRSINAGTVVVHHEPGDRVSRQLRECARAVLPPDLAARLPEPARRDSLWSRLLTRLRTRSSRPSLDSAPSSGGPA